MDPEPHWKLDPDLDPHDNDDLDGDEYDEYDVDGMEGGPRGRTTAPPSSPPPTRRRVWAGLRGEGGALRAAGFAAAQRTAAVVRRELQVTPVPYRCGLLGSQVLCYGGGGAGGGEGRGRKRGTWGAAMLEPRECRPRMVNREAGRCIDAIG
jgi:hypothetical protein